jgi:hypothetical protein
MFDIMVLRPLQTYMKMSGKDRLWKSTTLFGEFKLKF